MRNKSNKAMVNYIIRAIKKDYAGILTFKAIALSYGVSEEEIRQSLYEEGYRGEDGGLPLIEDVRDATKFERDMKFLDYQDLWLKSSAKTFEFVAQKAYAQYGDKSGEIAPIKLVISKNEDDNVDIG